MGSLATETETTPIVQSGEDWEALHKVMCSTWYKNKCR